MEAVAQTNNDNRFREELAYVDFTFTGEVKEIRLEIGGVCVLLRTDSQELCDLVRSNYKAYLSEKEPIAEIEIKCEKYEEVEATRPIRQYSPRFHVYTVETILQGSRVFFVANRAFVGMMDRRNSEVKFNFFTISSESLDSCLRITLPYLLVKYDCQALMFHACSVVTPAGGFLFPGRSGAGKTTIAKLAKEFSHLTVLADEISLVRKVDGTYRIFGTPFLGAELWDITRFTNTSVELRAILFPFKDKQISIRDLAPSRALVLLLPTVLSFFEDRMVIEMFMDLCINLLENVPARMLHFALNSDFWEGIYDSRGPICCQGK